MQPALFVSHGSPTLIIDPCPARDFLAGLGHDLARPDAIVMISAHYDVPGVAITSGAHPKTIHDFGGFPAELYRLTYPASGAPVLATEIATMLGDAGFAATLDPERGLDHGAWIPLKLAYPDADIPVLQVSIDSRQTPEWHAALGRALAPLRGRNILIIGSGSATHNLRAFFSTRPDLDSAAPDWVRMFADWLAVRLAAADDAGTLHAVDCGPYGRDNHPTMDHILPLFVAMGAGAGAPGRALHRSFAYGVLAMDAYAFG